MGSGRKSGAAFVVGLFCITLAVGLRPTWAELRDPDGPAVAQQRSSATVGWRGSFRGVLPTASSPRIQCPSEPRLGVARPRRLKVLGACRWAAGIVVGLAHEPDGDWHVNVEPSGRFLGLEDARNRTAVGGALVTEIMPSQNLPIPTLGEGVAVFGTWVHDKNHGWNEIHPIWAIRYLDRHRTVVSVP
jgi:hypothetical protein